MSDILTITRITTVKSSVKKEEFDRFVFGKLGCNRKYDITPTGDLIHTYFGLNEYNSFIRFFNIFPFVQLSTGSLYAAEFICERFLCSVTWGEHAIQVVFYENRERLLETVRHSQQHILNQLEYRDRLPTELLLTFSDVLFHE